VNKRMVKLGEHRLSRLPNVWMFCYLGAPYIRGHSLESAGREAPGLMVLLVQLRAGLRPDDGVHNDGAAGDSLFGNAWTVADGEYHYNVGVEAAVPCVA